jgi:hypothetical protein
VSLSTLRDPHLFRATPHRRSAALTQVMRDPALTPLTHPLTVIDGPSPISDAPRFGRSTDRNSMESVYYQNPVRRPETVIQITPPV